MYKRTMDIMDIASKKSRVKLNVGGTHFECYTSTLSAFPDSKLAMLNEASDNYDVERDEYFFDRNPLIFGHILDAYRSGDIHLPNNVCGDRFRDELSFWDISLNYVKPCCWEKVYRSESDIYTITLLMEGVKLGTNSNPERQRWKDKIWLMLDEPKSSKLAMVWGILITVAISASILITIGRTLDIFYTDDYTSQEKDVYRRMLFKSGYPYAKNVTTSGLQMILKRPSQALMLVDIVCFTFLTIELVLVFVFCPKNSMICDTWVRFCELLCNISFWILVGLELNLASLTSVHGMRACVAFRLLTILKVERLHRLTTKFRIFQIVYLTFHSSVKELKVLCIMLTILSTFYGILMFTAEFLHTDKFTNAFSAMYWALITLTTVGYGDYTPTTAFGHVIAAACAVNGVLILALPIGVVAAKFANFYGHYKYVSQHVAAYPSSEYLGKEIR